MPILPPNFRLILSPRAEEDFTDILQYTLENWGEKQMLNYRDVLDNALQTILQHPEIGHKRSELSAHHRLYLAGQHFVVYRVVEQSVLVSRILHQRMDVKRHV
jgi:toxin ParE1/3/4